MNEETENNLLQKDNPMKEWLVDYVGQKLQPQDGGVTIEMIVEAMAQEFPEFLLEVAKENWIRGYQQALYDIDNNELTKNEQETAESS